MHAFRFQTTRRFQPAALALAVVALVAAPVPASGPDEDVRLHPGYVDGAAFVRLADEDGELIEVTLGRKMLNLFTRRASKRHEDSLANILKDLVALNAVVADVELSREAAEREIDDTIARLRGDKRWEQFVHVREPGQEEFRAFIHMTDEGPGSREDDAKVDGLLVIGFTGPAEVIFVNLVGVVDMERICTLGERMGLPGLDELPPRSEVERGRRGKQQGT